ncbi:PulJ/GspJ family protein [Brockia lithotrophica]|uniref:Prepilin-type N-terminal cleavage/methylation domain-containing protein n=1 Tax=Brockia lithotrophica TaxID=933949 RepID=A0A660KWB0_9BACL|nr:prepilin-type N-terminal cleavage/methylation domain-containing protein [Brockia lithotrophica]RKQ84725.1 prepilin-type N-terminal cleavage/methylation domain-containing protein [Brockia lithotrophica]
MRQNARDFYRRKRQPKDAGVTLVELLAALAVGSLLLLGVYAITGLFTSTIGVEHAERSIDRQADAVVQFVERSVKDADQLTANGTEITATRKVVESESAPAKREVVTLTLGTGKVSRRCVLYDADDTSLPCTSPKGDSDLEVPDLLDTSEARADLRTLVLTLRFRVPGGEREVVRVVPLMR